MDNTNNRKRHAHKRPEAVQRTRQGEREPENRQSASRQDYKFTSGYSRSGSGVKRTRTSSVSHPSVTAREERGLTREDRRLVRQNEKNALIAKKEEEWQKDIVRVRGGIDIVMLSIILILVALGSVAVFSASYPLAVTKGYSPTEYILGQLTNVGLGIVFMFIASYFPLKWYRSWFPFFMYIVSSACLMFAFFYGTAVGVTQRWLNLGFVSIQPSELMKISLILMLAWYFDTGVKKVSLKYPGREDHYFYGIFVPCLIMGFSCALVMIGRHLSGTAIVAAIGMAILFAAKCNIKQLILTIVPVGVAGVAGYLITQPYALDRIFGKLAKDKDLLGDFYQTNQSVYAIGSGGLFGVGLGESVQKHSFLAASHTDFIFSIWCEELGFVGAVGLILLYLLFLWRGYTIAIKAPDRFTCLTAFGITTHIGVQAFLHMAVTTDMMFNTGVTLPFFSYGGSSTIVTLAEMGILLAISRKYYRKKQDIEMDELRQQIGLD